MKKYLFHIPKGFNLRLVSDKAYYTVSAVKEGSRDPLFYLFDAILGEVMTLRRGILGCSFVQDGPEGFGVMIYDSRQRLSKYVDPEVEDVRTEYLDSIRDSIERMTRERLGPLVGTQYTAENRAYLESAMSDIQRQYVDVPFFNTVNQVTIDTTEIGRASCRERGS